MRKFFMVALSVFVVAFLCCGCAAHSDADAMCEFDCDSVITLRIGTADPSEARALVPLLTNTLLHNIAIEYDDTIIDYQPATGRVEALRAGVTKIKTTVNGQTQSVQVNVEEAVYCSDFTVTDFVMELGKTADLFATNRNCIKVNSGYNMGYTFESLSPQILSVDAAGVVTALASGEGIVKVVAKTGIDTLAAGGYDTLFRMVNIEVTERREDICLSILDTNMREVEYSLNDDGAKCYTLFSRQNGNSNYILKISSDQSLKNCLFAENTTSMDCQNRVEGSSNTRLVVLSGMYQRAVDPHVVYQSFGVVDSGLDAIEKHVIDAGYNFYYNALSERIFVSVFRQATSSDITATVYNEAMVEYQNVNLNNDYCLYAGGTAKANFVYVVPTLADLCLDSWDFVANNLTVTRHAGCLRVSTGAKSGVGTLTICSGDGGGAERVISFYNYQSAITITSTAKSVNVLYLHDGSATFCAYYAVHDESGNVLSDQGVDFVFVDQAGEVISPGSDQITYTDWLYPTFAIQFVSTGKYTLFIKSRAGQYYSDVMFIYVYDENSLTK